MSHWGIVKCAQTNNCWFRRKKKLNSKFRISTRKLKNWRSHMIRPKKWRNFRVISFSWRNPMDWMPIRCKSCNIEKCSKPRNPRSKVLIAIWGFRIKARVPGVSKKWPPRLNLRKRPLFKGKALGEWTLPFRRRTSRRGKLSNSALKSTIRALPRTLV